MILYDVSMVCGWPRLLISFWFVRTKGLDLQKQNVTFFQFYALLSFIDVGACYSFLF